MNEEMVTSEIEQRLHTLFKDAFSTNCHLDQSSVTDEELRTLDDLDSLEVLENLKELLTTLLQFKAGRADFTLHSGIPQHLNSIIAQLEEEIKNHVLAEHELKKHIDAAALELVALKRDYSASQEIIKNLQMKLGLERPNNFELRLQNEIDRIKTRRKRNESIEVLKQQYEEKILSIQEQDRAAVKELRSRVEHLQKYIKCHEANTLRQKPHPRRDFSTSYKQDPRLSQTKIIHTLKDHLKHIRKPSMESQVSGNSSTKRKTLPSRTHHKRNHSDCLVEA